MLKQRIITASVLIPTMVLGIILLPTPILAFAMLIFTLIGAWEWTRLVGLSHPLAKVVYVALLGATLGWVYPLSMTGSYIVEILILTSIWWALACIWMVLQPVAQQAQRAVTALKLVAGWLVLVPPFVAIVKLHSLNPYGNYWVLFLFSLIWVADSGAYFSGKHWGSKKLAIKISPGKTWEGVYGAVLSVLVYSICVGLALTHSFQQLVWFILLCVLMVPVSVIGDLFESMMKRQVNMKDSGTIFPGHGGVMDRIDSLTAAAPLFVLGLMWLVF